MSKELNDIIIREGALAERMWHYRTASVPDGDLTDERRHLIVMSLKQERAELWGKIVNMCNT